MSLDICKHGRSLNLDCEYCEYEDILESQIKTVDPLLEYVDHTRDCIWSFWEAGEPTADGGYRTKFAGKWYQSKPINEEPKCTCGLDEALQAFNTALKVSRQ